MRGAVEVAHALCEPFRSHRLDSSRAGRTEERERFDLSQTIVRHVAQSVPQVERRVDAAAVRQQHVHVVHVDLLEEIVQVDRLLLDFVQVHRVAVGRFEGCGKNGTK